MCLCALRMEKRSCGVFLSLSHPDEVQSSGTVLTESCAVGSLSCCGTEEWDN